MRNCTCGCTTVEEDPSRGAKYCAGCGTVLEENAIVSDLAFKETSGGGCSLVGQFVKDGELGTSLLPSLRLGGSVESREVTIAKAKKQLVLIASQLNLNRHSVDMAVRFYRLALGRRLTIGRPVKIVGAALLYISCRLQNLPYMLIDFCDVIEVNLFDVGRMFSFIVREFYITLPLTDPSIYVLRFAQRLDLGKKEREVVTMSMRIIKKMQHDWIVIGRRPAGVCGAALLLSAKYHGINRTIEDIIDVVHVCATVVKKRLTEFSTTAAAQLTLDEFPLVDIAESADPPCFKAPEKETWTDEDLLKLSKQMKATEKRVSSALEALPTRRRRGRPRNQPYRTDPVTLEDCIHSVINPADVGREMALAALNPTPQFLGIIKKRKSEAEKEPPYTEETNSMESDIDDEEIDMYLLDDSEVELKTRVWHQINGAYYEDYEKRREEREQKQKEMKRPGSKRKRRRSPTQFNNANEAMKAVLVEKKLSKKINYDLLKFSSDEEAETPREEKINSTASVAAVSVEEAMTTALIIKDSANTEEATKTEQTVDKRHKEITASGKPSRRFRFNMKPNIPVRRA